MSRVKLALSASLMAVLLSACGIAAKPLAGSSSFKREKGAFYGRVQDLRIYPARCLKQDHLRFREYDTPKRPGRYNPLELQLPVIQVGRLPAGPTLVFYPTPGIAQGLQIIGQEQGAEAIGTALLYPNRAGTHELDAVQACAAVRVSG
ncbi:MAG: hypothetical protein ACRDKL_01100 [Solirubrobacteraceae bacterium]